MPDDKPSPNNSHFGDSNQIDPTPGWIPFVFVLGISVLFLIVFVFVALFVR